MFSRFVVSAGLLAAIGLGAGGGAWSYATIREYKTEIKELQAFCEAREITPTFVRVRRVVDGDTLQLESGETVRLIGPDTPEICHPKSGKDDPNCQDEPGGQAATEFTRQLTEGKEVILVGDPNEPSRDHFGRLLRYVYIGQRELGLELISRGLAPAYDRLARDTKFYAEYQAAEAEARSKKLGIWAN